MANLVIASAKLHSKCPRKETAAIKTSIIYTLPLVSAALFAAPAAVAIETDCKDPEAVAAWQDLLQRYPNDHDLRDLYLLRDDLCIAVERGSVDLIEASDRFERARARLIEKWQQQNERRELGAAGAG